MAMTQENSGHPYRAGLLAFLFLSFVVLTLAFRLLLVASPEQRNAASIDGDFAVVWEAWRTLEKASGGNLQVSDAVIEHAIQEMVTAASVGESSDLSERIDVYSARPPTSVPEGLGDIWRAWRILHSDYPDAPPDLLARAAIAGLSGEVGDRALRYLSEEEYAGARDFFAGDSYEGIGAYVDKIDGFPIILEPFLGGPAEEAGLQVGDRILAVAGQSVEGLTLDEVVDLVKGPSDTVVTIEVLGLDDLEPRTVDVTRRVVPGTSVYAQVLDDEAQIGYIRLVRFHRTTGEDFRTVLESLLERGIQGLILDMRNNPGGSLQAATEVTSQFVSDGLVMYEVSNDGQRSDWATLRGGLALDLPLAVLVNANSASAAEVVAGALQDHERADIYGERTYGKGSVQTFQELSDGSALYLTISRWHTPNGQQIEGLGIESDVAVPLTFNDYLNDIDRALVVAYDDLLEIVTSSDKEVS